MLSETTLNRLFYPRLRFDVSPVPIMYFALFSMRVREFDCEFFENTSRQAENKRQCLDDRKTLRSGTPSGPLESL